MNTIATLHWFGPRVREWHDLVVSADGRLVTTEQPPRVIDVESLAAIPGAVVYATEDNIPVVTKAIGLAEPTFQVLPCDGEFACLRAPIVAGVNVSGHDTEHGGRMSTGACFRRIHGRIVMVGYADQVVLPGAEQAHFGCGGKYTNLVFDVERKTDDPTRAEILAAGYSLKHPSQEEAEKANAEAWARIDANLAAEKKARSGGQAEDGAVPSDEKVTVVAAHVWATRRDGKLAAYNYRIKSEGFGATADSASLGPVEEYLRSPKSGAVVHYAANAAGGGFVGSWTGGPIQEVCYTLCGARWYLYVVTFSDIDDWAQEWWTSPRRLTAGVALDAIEASRRLAIDRQ